MALPPYANQCLALIKNSTLAIAIGYQDLMAVINTAITQTGLALEGISLALAAYLGLALALGGALSAWNARSARHGPGDLHGARLGERPALLAALAGKAADAGRGDWPGRRAAGGAARRRFARRLALLNAVWRRAAWRAAGACWAAVGENLPLLLFGAMQPAHRGPPWSPAPRCCWRSPSRWARAGCPDGHAPASPSPRWRCRRRAVRLALGRRGHRPLRWGGLLVTLILAIAALLAVPLAAGLALLRRSSSPAGSFAAATLIEAVRGVPLVTQLLFASFVLPMLLGGGVSKFSMALAALTLHTACLLAEVLRGALQAIPPGQMAAARALGMGSALAYQAVIWPQARRIAAPAALGVFVGAVRTPRWSASSACSTCWARPRPWWPARPGGPITSRSTWRWPRCTSRPAWRCRGWRGRWRRAALNGRPQKRSSRIAGSTSSRTKAASDRLSSARTIATTSCTGASVPSPRRLASSRATASPSSVFR